ncbi:MAG: hypothetical protein EBR14_04410, partial [Methylophilaceae bacterium]|nr:hypothetical protein [Methylophilaceae bacterium]
GLLCSLVFEHDGWKVGDADERRYPCQYVAKEGHGLYYGGDDGPLRRVAHSCAYNIDGEANVNVYLVKKFRIGRNLDDGFMKLAFASVLE